MARRIDRYDDWDQVPPGADVADEDEDRYPQAYADRRLAEREYPQADALPSLVGVSATITNYGAPLLSYSRTMQRFYKTRKRVMSLGRHVCAICKERIPGWAWSAPNGNHAHDGCYDRMAWAWATVYAEQQHMAARGELE